MVAGTIRAAYRKRGVTVMRILVVDDDLDLVELLTYALRRAGFTTISAADLPTVIKLVKDKQPALVLLEVGLGGSDGFDVLRSVRQISDVPVIIVSGRDSEDDRVLGLEQGADDYVIKPFSHRELVGRIRAQLRRRAHGVTAPPPAAVLQAGCVSLDVARHTTVHEGRRINLTANEFQLLRCLLANAGSVVPMRTILKEIWGHDRNDPDVVRSTVCRLRRKLDDDPSSPRLLHTVRGVGIMLTPQPIEAVMQGSPASA
jgi:two-component system, OmpR family, response regulator VicR